MLRINELKLPLNHPEPALRAAILARLGIADGDLIDFSVFKRSYDARKKAAIVLIYSIDVEVRNEAAVLARLAKDQHVMPSPDTGYKFVEAGKPPAGTPRPVVIGMGPCGMFVALILQHFIGPLPIINARVLLMPVVMFYGSLAPFGVLALGSKETLRFTRYEDRYEAVDAKEKIFRRVR